MKVSTTAFPNIHKAFVAIERDNGFHHYERIQGRDCDYDKRAYEVPEFYAGMLVIANATLSVMTEEEIDVVCTGEYEESREIIGSYDSDGQVVEALLNAFFNDWLAEDDVEDAVDDDWGTDYPS